MFVIDKADIDLISDHAPDIFITWALNIWEEEREPFSWGEMRGIEVAASAKIISARIGDLILSREGLAKMIGQAAVERMEDTRATEEVGKYR